ncbi:glycoside hydrolase [Geoanaerobacter pelophilus]|uniref:beta-fructofuranosidase n=1 Tax=Geoanaerobacter pelophilus TaxID=60036 RepID=A0ABQ0MG63_9BACT|nr:glycoside hydrolase 100 family protein [Geoanaerobacter pelophilus]GAW66090.1 glycoside hydrolase [Geoanaerobacter pelophilus]
MDHELMTECYREALALLRENSTPGGILASGKNPRSEGRNYTSIFGRDASICALGMAASGDAELGRTAAEGLLTLARYQAVNGQIPKYVKPESGEADFWYSGCIDATLWWLIAIRFMDRFLPEARLGERLAPQTTLALSWLNCQEHQVWRLLQQLDASDWADIMPRAGYVLYTNVLWYWVKTLYALPTAAETKEYLNTLLSPFGRTVPAHKRARLLVHYIRNRSKPTPFYLSFVNFSDWGEEIDVFGNIMAHLVGVSPPSTGDKVVEALLALKANQPHPIRVVGDPIRPGSRLWRPYMQRHRQNLAWQYHNGGAWPFVGGFWVLLLARLGRTGQAWSELEKLARTNRVNGWEFNEWFQGETGEPMGMPRQSWNAALYVLAYRTLADGTRYLP